MRNILTAAIALLLIAARATGSEPAGDADQPRRRVIYNLDSSEFYVGTFGPVEPRTIARFVDEHAALGVTDLFVNVNHQRTNYESKVWDAGWTGLDPDSVDVEWIRNQRIFHEQGFDYPRLMLERAHERGIGAWISIRMNDAHLPDQPNHPLHSSFWKNHPEWHLENGGLDFEVPEVREHYMQLIREVCGRYDFDGLELDFLRFPLYFRPGDEVIGAPLMTTLVEEVREATGQAARRLGHSVFLAVRAPTSPEVSRRHGLDAVSWGKRGLVDMIVATPWWTSANSDIPVEDWKEELDGSGVEVAVSIEEGIDSGGLPRRTMTPDEMRGIFVSAWSRGADAVYFFNLFTNPLRRWPRNEYDAIIRDAGDPEALKSRPRRHVLTMADPWSPTDPKALRLLPSAERDVTFRIHIGPAPASDQTAHIELVLDDPDSKPTVRLNGQETTWSGVHAPAHLSIVGLDPAEEPPRSIYSFPSAELRGGYNEIEVTSDGVVTIRWVEIAIAER
ncbi:MAG: hypothetical protein WBW88_19640 [Rhodothermales bacterium]